MKIAIGAVFNWQHNTTIYALELPGIGIIQCDKDEHGFNIVDLNKRQLIKLKREIEKELEMKNPYNKREDKDMKKSFKVAAKSVKPVAKDTNKTRRKMVKPTSRGK